MSAKYACTSRITAWNGRRTMPKLRRLKHDGIAGLDAVMAAELGGDGNPACPAQLGMNDMIHLIGSRLLIDRLII